MLFLCFFEECFKVNFAREVGPAWLADMASHAGRAMRRTSGTFLTSCKGGHYIKILRGLHVNASKSLKLYFW